MTSTFTINIQQLSRIYQRGLQVVVSKNVAVQSHMSRGELDIVLEIARDALTSDHLLNNPVSTEKAK